MFILPNNILHVYFVNIHSTFLNEATWFDLLSKEEKSRASRFRFEKHRNQFIITKAALKIISGYYLNLNPKEIVFKYGEYGKPDFDLDTNLKFNVSHSGNMAVLGFVNNFEIGIDIETIKTDFDVLDIAKKFFSELEIKTLLKLPKENQFEGFYRCWTRKESFIKAKAKGLSFPLDSFSVSIDSHEHAKLLETKWDANEKGTWNLFSFSPRENYIGAVSVQGNIESVEYRNFDDLKK